MSVAPTRTGSAAPAISTIVAPATADRVSMPDATALPTKDWSQAKRLGGLHRFAAAITVLNLLGHGFLGFETSWAHPLVALATGYSLEILLEVIDARAKARPLRFLGDGVMGTVNFLLSAHISGLAVSMLLYPNGGLMPVVFATAAAIGSKVVFRTMVAGRLRHVMNPSNFGISLTLVLFPWVGIAAPYQFTENVAGFWDWGIPLIIICSGTFINFRFTSRLPLLAAWLLGFVAQAAIRSMFFEATFAPSLAPMTGLAFLLFTFYMVTDPPTTPASTRNQVFFGASVAAAYGLLMALHVVFGLFFSLVIVCSVRGIYLSIQNQRLPISGVSAAKVEAT
jgi:hypothetical protein